MCTEWDCIDNTSRSYSTNTTTAVVTVCPQHTTACARRLGLYCNSDADIPVDQKVPVNGLLVPEDGHLNFGVPTSCPRATAHLRKGPPVMPYHPQSEPQFELGGSRMPRCRNFGEKCSYHTQDLTWLAGKK